MSARGKRDLYVNFIYSEDVSCSVVVQLVELHIYSGDVLCSVV